MTLVALSPADQAKMIRQDFEETMELMLKKLQKDQARQLSPEQLKATYTLNASLIARVEALAMTPEGPASYLLEVSMPFEWTLPPAEQWINYPPAHQQALAHVIDWALAGENRTNGALFKRKEGNQQEEMHRYFSMPWQNKDVVDYWVERQSADPALNKQLAWLTPEKRNQQEEGSFFSWADPMGSIHQLEMDQRAFNDLKKETSVIPAPSTTLSTVEGSGGLGNHEFMTHKSDESSSSSPSLENHLLDEKWSDVVPGQPSEFQTLSDLNYFAQKGFLTQGKVNADLKRCIALGVCFRPDAQSYKQFMSSKEKTLNLEQTAARAKEWALDYFKKQSVILNTVGAKSVPIESLDGLLMIEQTLLEKTPLSSAIAGKDFSGRFNEKDYEGYWEKMPALAEALVLRHEVSEHQKKHHQQQGLLEDESMNPVKRVTLRM